MPPIVAEAHKRGLRVSGHVPAFMTAEQVVRLGFDEIQHVNFLVLNFIDSVKDTRAMSRFTAVGNDAATLDLSSPRVRAFIQLLRDRHIVSDPTVAPSRTCLSHAPGRCRPTATFEKFAPSSRTVSFFRARTSIERSRSSRSEAFHPVSLLRWQPHLYSSALSQSASHIERSARLFHNAVDRR